MSGELIGDGVHAPPIIDCPRCGLRHGKRWACDPLLAAVDTPDAGPALDERGQRIERIRERHREHFKITAESCTTCAVLARLDEVTQGRDYWKAEANAREARLREQAAALATTPPAPGDRAEAIGAVGLELARQIRENRARPDDEQHWSAAKLVDAALSAPAPGDDELREALRDVVEAGAALVGLDEGVGRGGYSPHECAFCEASLRPCDPETYEDIPVTHQDGCEWAVLAAAIARADATLGATTTGEGE